ncbi:MAG: UDP-N-acetylglucosamine 2-epimerase (hydrolyzing) [Nitrospiraceae bacterium]|nr:MAG: UDP-N-acetylglucosamine 2-epimerase (hydrolyzing) [Nitrospiraceae bacterium]
MRNIAVVTGTRADYGLLYHIIKGIYEDPDLGLSLVVTSMHLSPEFGMTVKDIERDGFPVAEKIDMLLSSDTREAIAASMGLGMIGFAKAYARLKPDILVLLGDRFEIHAAASAAVPFGIPVAHIHGGELTKGSMDELFRHSITKMSHLHFVSTEKYASRIRQMGERPENVFVTGAPGLDNIIKLKLFNRARASEEIGIPVDKEWGVVTYHPETLERENSSVVQIKEILNALDEFPLIHWIFTFPNADTDSRAIVRNIEAYVRQRKGNSSVFISLGQLKYLSLLKNASVMAGNSSSGIIEAPSFKLPVVNIGSRQDGRIRARNVIDVPVCKKNNIINAVRKSLSKDFRDSLKGLKNPYGNGHASSRIVKILKRIPLSRLQKNFYDLKTGRI